MGYRVRRAGSPMDSGFWYETQDEAERAALMMARAMVPTFDGTDIIRIYDLRSRGGGWGACPEGHDGAYYPVIMEE